MINYKKYIKNMKRKQYEIDISLKWKKLFILYIIFSIFICKNMFKFYTYISMFKYNLLKMRANERE